MKLRAILCPRAKEIIARADSGEGTIVAILADTTLTFFVDGGYPVTVLAREIARVGLERFCRDPEILLQRADV